MRGGPRWPPRSSTRWRTRRKRTRSRRVRTPAIAFIPRWSRSCARLESISPTRAPQRLTAELAKGTHTLVMMGYGDECPVVPGAKRDDWPLTDPKGKPRQRVREIRDDIEARVRALIKANDWA